MPEPVTPAIIFRGETIMPTALPRRADVPEEHTWDLHSVFPSDEAWEAALAEVSAALPDLETFRGKLGDSSTTLLQALQAVDTVMTRVARIWLYAAMQAAGDTADPRYIARQQQAMSLSARAQAATAYLQPELLALDPARLQALLAEENELRSYAHYS